MRFVILFHQMPANSPRSSHWDFLLEHTDGTLRSWALSDEPAFGAEIPAEALPDHRREYLDYEGPISGDRGRVTRWDRGTYRTVSQFEHEWQVEIAGERLVGRVSLLQDEAVAGCWKIRFDTDPAGIPHSERTR